MTDKTGTPREPTKVWVEAPGRDEADIAPGRVYDGAAIHPELRASIKRMERGETPAPYAASISRQ